MSSSNVGMIYIRRERRFIGSAMSFQVFIDGIPVGTITNGQEVVFQLQQGRRAVQLKTHWKRLEKLMIIEAKPGETIYLKCRARFKDIELYYDNILNRSEQPTSTSETQREHTYNTLDLQIVREDNIVENSHIIDIEKFPLDNIFGNDVLSVEIEISKTVSTELSINNSTERSIDIGAELFSIIKGALSNALTKQTGHVIGQTISRRHTVKFNVQPNKSVTYHIIWKRKVRTGLYEVLMDREKISVPYRMDYDLSYEIKTE